MSEEVALGELERSYLRELHERYRRSLLSFFMRRMNTPAEAEDLTQEVFYRVSRAAAGGGIKHGPSLLFVTAANLLRDRARKRRSHSAEMAIDDPLDLAACVAAENFEPDRVLIAKERLSEVLAALDELPPRTRDLFLLFRVERMKQRDIAALAGISVSSVEKQIVRATLHLAGRLTAPDRDACD